MQKEREEFQKKAKIGVVAGLGALVLVGLFQVVKDGSSGKKGRSSDWKPPDADTGPDFEWHPPARG